jgi:hypothetical protein
MDVKEIRHEMCTLDSPGEGEVVAIAECLSPDLHRFTIKLGARIKAIFRAQNLPILLKNEQTKHLHINYN